jgi:hypothetical protein
VPFFRKGEDLPEVRLAGRVKFRRVEGRTYHPTPEESQVGNTWTFDRQVEDSLVTSPLPGLNDITMRQILDTEEHVQIPPMMYSDPFYRITYLIKEEIRKYKWIEGEKGRKLSWEEARREWTDAHRQQFERFLIDTLSVAAANEPLTTGEEPPAEEERRTPPGLAGRLSQLPHQAGG